MKGIKIYCITWIYDVHDEFVLAHLISCSHVLSLLAAFPKPQTTLGFVRLHQSSSGLAWIGIKSMPQSMPQNNP